MEVKCRDLIVIFAYYDEFSANFYATWNSLQISIITWIAFVIFFFIFVIYCYYLDSPFKIDNSNKMYYNPWNKQWTEPQSHVDKYIM